MENKTQIKIFLKSTLTVCILSILISTGLNIVGINFISAFLLSTAIQYILFVFVGGIVNNFLTHKTKQLELEKLEQLSTILQCSSCNKNNLITFIPDDNERVEFKCQSCTKINVVSINFTVAGITDLVSPLPNIEDIKEPLDYYEN